jgi:hypothetical protein
MIERHLHGLWTENPGREEPGDTRDRLKDRFPRGAVRRMTQLGMLLGSVFSEIDFRETDAVVYASSYAEARTLEEYLASFPAPSPTLFQTSIHPSAVQQALIARHQPVHHFFPLTGGLQLVAHAVQAALLAPNPRVVLCGGEERGTWSCEHGIASAESFAFAALLLPEPAGALASLSLAEAGAGEGALGLADFFAALCCRRAIDQAVAPGLSFTLQWHPTP